VNSIGVVAAPVTARWRTGGQVGPRTHRMTWCPRSRAMVRTPIYDGPSLPAQARIAGPAVIEHPGTTIVVLAGQAASVDDQRHTHIATAAARRS